MYLVLSIHTAVSRTCFQKSPHCPCSMHNYAVYSFLPVCSIHYNSFSIPLKIDIQDRTQKGLENNAAKWALNWKFSRNPSASPNSFYTAARHLYSPTYVWDNQAFQYSPVALCSSELRVSLWPYFLLFHFLYSIGSTNVLYNYKYAALGIVL